MIHEDPSYMIILGVLSRCTHIRLNGEKVPLTATLKDQIQALINKYGTGADTLRCLALGTVGKSITNSQITTNVTLRQPTS